MTKRNISDKKRWFAKHYRDAKTKTNWYVSGLFFSKLQLHDSSRF